MYVTMANYIFLQQFVPVARNFQDLEKRNSVRRKNKISEHLDIANSSKNELAINS